MPRFSDNTLCTCSTISAIITSILFSLKSPPSHQNTVSWQLIDLKDKFIAYKARVESNRMAHARPPTDNSNAFDEPLFGALVDEAVTKGVLVATLFTPVVGVVIAELVVAAWTLSLIDLGAAG